MKILRWKKNEYVSLLDSIPERNGEVAWRSMNKESAVILLNMKTGIFYLLRGKEADIWKLCDGKRTCREMVSMAKERFRGTHEKEITRFTSKLVENRLAHLLGNENEK